MKIAISGSHGTGKTALFEELVGEHVLGAAMQCQVLAATLEGESVPYGLNQAAVPWTIPWFSPDPPLQQSRPLVMPGVLGAE